MKKTLVILLILAAGAAVYRQLESQKNIIERSVEKEMSVKDEGLEGLLVEGETENTIEVIEDTDEKNCLKMNQVEMRDFYADFAAALESGRIFFPDQDFGEDDFFIADTCYLEPDSSVFLLLNTSMELSGASFGIVEYDTENNLMNKVIWPEGDVLPAPDHIELRDHEGLPFSYKLVGEDCSNLMFTGRNARPEAYDDICTQSLFIYEPGTNVIEKEYVRNFTPDSKTLGDWMEKLQLL